MNTVQEAIARVVGFDNKFASQDAELQEITSVMEHLIADNQMLQREIEDLDYLNLFESNQIQEILPLRDRRKAVARLRRLRHDNPLAKQAVKLIIRFTLGRGVQWVLAQDKADPPASPSPTLLPVDQQRSSGIVPIRFTDSTPPPKGSKVSEAEVPVASDTPPNGQQDLNDPERAIIQAFWQAPDNKLAFTTHRMMQQCLDELVTDGEKFYAAFEDPSPPYVLVSEIPLEEINLTIYDPDNRLRPVLYRRQYQDMKYDAINEQLVPQGDPKVKYYWDYRIIAEDQKDLLKKIKIPLGKIDKDAHIFHVMVNEIWTKAGKRGVSELYSSREWFRVFREFMEGRAAINQAAQAISYLRKVKGSPTTVAKFSGKLGTMNVGDAADVDGITSARRLSRPVQGAIYDSNEAVDLQWMHTDTGAQNAKEDARLLLMSAGAGVGTMVHYFGEGGDANLATAQSMELPMVKSYEDWQQIVESFNKDWFEYALRVAKGNDSAARDEAAEVIKRVGHTFPPIISQDVVKYTTAWAQIVRDLAPNNMVVKKEAIRAALAIMGVPNIDGLMPEIEQEMAHSELLRQQQAQAMIEFQATAAKTAATNSPVAGNVPNDGMDPNTKHLVAGKGVKTANGPKAA